MHTFNLLIIEDDISVVEQYTTASEMLTDELNIQIIPTIATTLKEAQCILHDTECIIDGAIIDLKLSATSESHDAEGNTIIKEILSIHRFPIIVNSGYVGDLADELKAQENGFFKIYTRGECNTKDLIKYLINIHSLGITDILNSKGLIHYHLTNIFWKHLSSNLEYFTDLSHLIPSKDIHKIILRFICTYLQEYLNLNSDGFEDYHTNEMYLIPPINTNLFSGDIISYEEKNFVIISPPCDFASKGIKLITVCQIIALDKLDEELPRFKKSKILNLLRNNGGQEYHFLPPAFSFKGGIIDFHRVTSISACEIEESGDRIASISPTFFKDILARFGIYYSRQGQPSFMGLNSLATQLENLYTEKESTRC